MISEGLVTLAVLSLLAVVIVLSTLIVLIRGVRSHEQRRRERTAEPVRGLLFELLCAEGDEQNRLLERLAAIDRRAWSALEPHVAELLEKVSGGARTALIRLYGLRGATAAAVTDLTRHSAVRRGRAAQVLGRLAHTPAVPTLCRLLDDRDPEVRRAAARALGRCRDPAAVPYLLACLTGPRTVPPGVVTHALSALGPEGMRSVAVGLDHPEHLARAVAVEVLGETGAVSRTAEVVHALRADTHAEVRIRAARALGRLGMPDGLEPLLAAVPPGRPVALRIVAVSALGSLGAVAATPRLAALLDDTDPHVAATAARALLRLGPQGEAALRSAADGSRPDGRAAAHARAALAEAAVGGTRLDVRAEVAL
ncbi:HEAT repeat domain-containing protein [Streptomyces sp. NPDC006332]|uniref:HEAT repeat domain-containing protein n=1 Tax=Streptomyces sp. NPDC006332 TaxID=3155456 RepID=UPI0033A72CA1